MVAPGTHKYMRLTFTVRQVLSQFWGSSKIGVPTLFPKVGGRPLWRCSCW